MRRKQRGAVDRGGKGDRKRRRATTYPVEPLGDILLVGHHLDLVRNRTRRPLDQIIRRPFARLKLLSGQLTTPREHLDSRETLDLLYACTRRQHRPCLRRERGTHLRRAERFVGIGITVDGVKGHQRTEITGSLAVFRSHLLAMLAQGEDMGKCGV